MLKNYPVPVRIALYLFIIVLFFHAAISARDFLYPVVLGLLLGYLLYPVTCFFEKYGIPRIPASILSIIIFLGVVGAIVFFIYKQAGNLLNDFPLFKQRALGNIDKLEQIIEEEFGITNLRLTEFLRIRTKYLFETGSDFLNNFFTTTAGTVFRLGILPVYIFLFLYYRTKLAYFILKMVKYEKKLTAIKVLKEFSTVVSRYMGGIFTVVLILCFINTGAMIVIGIDYPVIFGITSALFAFIPYFGTLIGGSIPFLFAILTGSSPAIALKVAIAYLIIHSIENNILTPNIVGSNLRLNPMVIIIGIIAAGMIWGIPGMFAIVPLLAMFNILSENVDNLNPYAFLFGVSGTRRHAITVENVKKFISRLKTKLKRKKK